MMSPSTRSPFENSTYTLEAGSTGWFGAVVITCALVRT